MFTDQFVESLAAAVAARVIGHIGTQAGQQKRLTTVEEAAAYIGRSKQAMYHLISTEKVPTKRQGARVFIDRQALDRWIDDLEDRRVAGARARVGNMTAMGNTVKGAVPPELERLIPAEIQKGVYYRLYPRKDGATRLVWWIKVYDRDGRPIYESTDSSRYTDAVALHRKLTAQVESQHRTGGDADSVRIGQLLDEFLSDGTEAKDSTK